MWSLQGFSYIDGACQAWHWYCIIFMRFERICVNTFFLSLNLSLCEQPRSALVVSVFEMVHSFCLLPKTKEGLSQCVVFFKGKCISLHLDLFNHASRCLMCRYLLAERCREILPVAETPGPRVLSAEEQRRLAEQEENTLRELRLFLRDVTKRLATDKRFNIFSKPVDIEEV